MPNTGGYRSSTSSARTHTSSNSYRLVSTAPNTDGHAFTSSSNVGGNKLHSSNLLASSSKLKAPTKNDAEKMLHRSLTSNASTGGNGIRRPYGRFIASRGGLALSVWERQAPMAISRGSQGGKISRQSISSPYFPQVKANRTSTSWEKTGRNVSKYNVSRRAYTSRSMDMSSKSVESKYSFQGTDTINYSNSTIIDVPLFSRPRPEGMSSLSAERSSTLLLGSNSNSKTKLHYGGSKTLPAATFLTHIPTLPRAVRVDCGQSCGKQFLTRVSPHERHNQVKEPTASSLLSGDSAVHLSSQSLKSLSSLGLPEVLSGALSMNINQLNKHHSPVYKSSPQVNINKRQAQAFFSTM